MNEVEMIKSVLKTAFHIINPWKKSGYRENYELKNYQDGFYDGWNGCLKEIKKNQKELMEFYDKNKAHWGKGPQQQA